MPRSAGAGTGIGMSIGISIGGIGPPIGNICI
jgi:hypothetical protein